MCRMQRLLLHWFHDHAHLIGQVANYSLIHSRTRKPIDLTAPWRRVTMSDLVKEAMGGFDFDALDRSTPEKEAEALAAAKEALDDGASGSFNAVLAGTGVAIRACAVAASTVASASQAPAYHPRGLPTASWTWTSSSPPCASHY